MPSAYTKRVADTARELTDSSSRSFVVRRTSLQTGRPQWANTPLHSNLRPGAALQQGTTKCRRHVNRFAAATIA